MLPFKLSPETLEELKNKACDAQQLDQSEVCGLLVTEDGTLLSFDFLPNESDRAGSYSLSFETLEERVAQLSKLGKTVIGSFHSHPISEAIPGPRDIENAFYNGIELIYDVCGEEARLWSKPTEEDEVCELELVILPPE